MDAAALAVGVLLFCQLTLCTHIALQRRHHLEGAPDPFPSEVNSPTVSRPQNLAPVDPDSQGSEAFPSLAPSPVNVSKSAAPAWGAPTGPRLAAHVPQVTESFTLSAIDLSTAGKDGKPTTLGEIMKQVMANYKIRIEASTNQKTRQTTFHLKADSRKELEKGKRSLLASLSPVVRCLLFVSVSHVTIRTQVTIVVCAPASTIPSIIGSKGKDNSTHILWAVL